VATEDLAAAHGSSEGEGIASSGVVAASTIRAKGSTEV